MRKFLYISILSIVLICLCDDASYARKRQGRKNVDVSSRIVDADGNPVSKASVLAGEGAVLRYSDADGVFTIPTRADGVILIEAEGFMDFVLDLKAGSVPSEIELVPEGILEGENDRTARLDGPSATALSNTQAISFIDTDKLLKYPDLNLTNAFQGQAAGLIVRGNSGGLGENAASFYVRGLHASGTAAIVVVDGMERSIDDISAEEIASVQILKDAPAKALYGPRAANGVVLITTKRGEAYKKPIRVTAEYGISPSTRTPEFLGAYDYASLFNEARQNDGLSPYYSAEQLEGYRNSAGENDLYHPDNDWYSRFAGGLRTYRKANAEFSGGNRTMQYALFIGYTGGSGLESVGKRTDLNRLNLRGNLDIRINDFISAVADVSARMSFKKNGGLKEDALYSGISTLRPNEYPLTVSADVLGIEPDKDGIPYFGGSVRNSANILDDMQYGGYSLNQSLTSQADLGIRLDLNRFVTGLTADAFFTLDNCSSINSVMTKYHATYAMDSYINADGDRVNRIQQVRKLNDSDDINIDSQIVRRTMGFNADAAYSRVFGRHGFSGVLAFRYYMDKAVGKTQDCVTTNTTARFNWSFDKRFFAELVLGMMGSNQFGRNRRYLFTPALSLGWIASMDPYVKVKASAGRVGYDPNSDYLLYSTTWSYPGDYSIGEFGSAPLNYRTALNVCGNPDIGWITSEEYNVGVELMAFRKRLSAEMNCFYEMRRGGITSLGSTYSSVLGQYVMSANTTDVSNHGVELGLKWNDSAAGGDFTYGVGMNFTYTKNMIVRTNEIEATEDWRKTVGRPTSGIFGLESEGLFGKDVELGRHARQNYGDYTIGDVAYRDMNGDSQIDDRDKTYLGQRFPVTVWGIDINLNYKGFGFYALATAETGASMLLNSVYWWNTGTDSYSVKALDRYHPVNNPGGSLPRLTATSGTNSYQNSDFWLADASFLRLKNVELSYTWKLRKLDSALKQTKFFVRGTNLCVLSAVKDVDPETPDAGLSNYPAYMTVTAGLTLSF